MILATDLDGTFLAGDPENRQRLYQLICAHPGVCVHPTAEKEVHFFDREFDKGWAWYESFFPPDSEAGRYVAHGEVTRVVVDRERFLDKTR